MDLFFSMLELGVFEHSLKSTAADLYYDLCRWASNSKPTTVHNWHGNLEICSWWLARVWQQITHRCWRREGSTPMMTYARCFLVLYCNMFIVGVEAKAIHLLSVRVHFPPLPHFPLSSQTMVKTVIISSLWGWKLWPGWCNIWFYFCVKL